MQKQLLSLTLGLAAALPTVVLADGPIDGSVYGKVNLTLERSDINAVGEDQVELNSNASRIGFAGKTELDSMFDVIYKVEWEVDPDGDGTTLKQRNSYVGVQGSFGTLFAGINDTPTKMAAEGGVDQFNDLSGDIKNVLEGETRASNILFYQSPELAGFTLNFAPTLGEQAANESRRDLFDSWSSSLEWSNDMLTLVAAHDDNVASSDFAGVKRYLDIDRFVAMLKLGSVTLAGLVQEAENSDTVLGGYESSGWHVSASWKLDDWTLKAQHTENDIDSLNAEARLTSLGADYKLGSNTKLFGFYTMLEETRNRVRSTDADSAGIGLEHKF